jgi:hypothetical protein
MQSEEAREVLAARIVPVDPLLSNVSADDARLSFYWPDVATDGVSSCRLIVRLGTLRRSGL